MSEFCPLTHQYHKLITIRGLFGPQKGKDKESRNENKEKENKKFHIFVWLH